MLVERPAVAAADVAGADVVVPAQPRAVLGEAEHVAGAVDVDPHGEGRGTLRSYTAARCQISVVRAATSGPSSTPGRGGEVAAHQLDAARQRRVGRLELGGPLLGQRLEPGLHQAGRPGRRRAAQDAGQQARAEEPREAGDEDRCPWTRILAPPRGGQSTRPPAHWPQAPAPKLRRSPDRPSPASLRVPESSSTTTGHGYAATCSPGSPWRAYLVPQCMAYAEIAGLEPRRRAVGDPPAARDLRRARARRPSSRSGPSRRRPS